MPQITSWTIANSGGSTYRAAVNSALAAVQSSSSGTAAPSPTVAGMLWYDTTNSILRRRNTANTAWIEVNADTQAANTFWGNPTGSAAAAIPITAAQARTTLGFSQSLGVNGYVALPGGSIVQWGAGTTGGGGTLAVIYPTAFTTIGRVVITNQSISATTATADVLTTSGFTARTFSTVTGTLGASAFSWIAVGY